MMRPLVLRMRESYSSGVFRLLNGANSSRPPRGAPAASARPKVAQNPASFF